MTARAGAPSGLSSSDDAEVRAAVRDLAAQLRSSEGTNRVTVAEQLAPLASHRSPRVRQAIAEACELLPDPHAESLLRAPAADRDAFVRRAADRSVDRRARRRAAERKDDEHERVAAEILATTAITSSARS